MSPPWTWSSPWRSGTCCLWRTRYIHYPFDNITLPYLILFYPNLSYLIKNVIGARRASWRIISSIEQKEEHKGSEDKLGMIRTYRDQVEKELKDICQDILDVLDKHLIPSR